MTIKIQKLDKINIDYDNYYLNPYKYKYKNIKEEEFNNFDELINLLLQDIDVIFNTEIEESKETIFDPTLFKLIANNNIKDFNILVKNNKVNINIQDKDGDTPLHIAVFLCNYEFIKKILSLDINLLLKDKWGQLSIHRLCFCINNKKIENVLKLFVEFNNKHCLDIFNKQDNFGNTTFHLILKHLIKNSINLEDHHINIINILKKYTNLSLINIDNNSIEDLLYLIDY